MRCLFTFQGVVICQISQVTIDYELLLICVTYIYIFFFRRLIRWGLRWAAEKIVEMIWPGKLVLFFLRTPAPSNENVFFEEINNML